MYKSDPFYRTQRWLTLSKSVRALHPICQLCRLQMSQCVDHVDEDITNNSLDNLRALCISCHSWKTATRLLAWDAIEQHYHEEIGDY